MPYVHETTPEKEAEIARQALAAGDLQHAIYHIGTALQFDPKKPEWLKLLDEVLGRTPDALTLVRADDPKSDFISAATRAYVLAKQGQTVEALALLAAVTEVRPDVPFLLWGVGWIRDPAVVTGLTAELIGKRLLPPLMHFVSHIPSPIAEDDARKDNLEAAAHILAKLAESQGEDPHLLFARSLVARRQGHFEHAIYWAYQAFEKDGNWNTAIGVALANRDAGKVDDAISWYRHALQLDPEDMSARLDIGDTLLEAERWDEAIAAYEEILARQKDHPWAVPSIVYAQYKKSGDDKLKHELFALAATSGRAWSLFCEIEPPEPYIHSLPPAADATVNALRGVMRQLADNPEQAQGGTVTLGVTHPESPSVLNAFRLWTQQRGVQIGIELQVEKAQTPDPRVAKAEVDFSLWTYDGFAPRPAVDAPDPRMAAAIAGIATGPYNLEIYIDKARQLAETIKLGPQFLPHLTATMVHPPPLPDDQTDPVDWILRIQIACALMISLVDEAWNPSHRRRALYSLIMGPVDWTVDAALVVLGWLGRNDAAIRADAVQMFSWLESQIPENGYTTFEYPLVCAWLSMGGHDEASQKRLEQWRLKVEQRGRAAPDAGPAEEVHGGLTLEQYAEFSVRRDAIVQKQASSGVAGGLAAMMGGGAFPELEALSHEFGVDPSLVSAQAGAAVGRIAEWDERINHDPRIAEMYFAMQNDARLKLQGIEFNEHDGRVAEMIRSGHFDTEGAMVNAQAAAQQMASGEGGDPDPVVFPGQAVERLSQYVGLMKHMQTGDMMGALKRFGLDMGSYTSVAQAWGVKLAGDPILNAKFSEMMSG